MSIFTFTLLPRHVLDFRLDAHTVPAMTEVLLVQVLLDQIEHRPVEGLAGGKAHVFQALLQILGLDLLVAGDLEALDRRPLDHRDDEVVAVPAQLHVAEEIRCVEGTNRFAHPLRRDAGRRCSRAGS